MNVVDKNITEIIAKANESTAPRVVFDESNPNWERNLQWSMMFLKSMMNHMNDLLNVRGHVFLNDVYDRLGIDRTPEGQLIGWTLDGAGHVGFDYVVSAENPVVIMLTFHVDGVIVHKI